LSIDKNQRRRGSDEPDAPLLLDRDGAIAEGDVVIGGKQRNQGDHGAGGGLQQALAIEAKGRESNERRRGRASRRPGKNR
jgi:hypothetical protein